MLTDAKRFKVVDPATGEEFFHVSRAGASAHAGAIDGILHERQRMFFPYQPLHVIVSFNPQLSAFAETTHFGEIL